MSGTQVIQIELVRQSPAIELQLPALGTQPADARLLALAVGQKGEPGGTQVQYPAATALGGHRVVIFNADGSVGYADARQLDHAPRVLGVTTGASVEGAVSNIQAVGPMTESSWSWTPNLPVYLGQNGLLTQTPPAQPQAAFSLVIGVAVSATTLLIGLGNVIHLTP